MDLLYARKKIIFSGSRKFISIERKKRGGGQRYPFNAGLEILTVFFAYVSDHLKPGLLKNQGRITKYKKKEKNNNNFL